MRKYFYILFLISSINTKAQIISTVAGNGTGGYTGDGGIATLAELKNPYELAFDSSGNLYISDFANNTIRKVNTSGIITTIAGTGIQGYSGDNAAATAAKLNKPIGLTFDKAGNLYIGDWGNHRIRKINSSGIITTIAGNGTQGHSGDNGLATLAKLDTPLGITFDTLGNLYIAEEFGNTIRKVNTTGIITTIAGTGVQGYSGDNGPATTAQLSLPGQITFDKGGNLYIGDEGNNRIRKINTSGIITTIAGTGVAGYNGDNGLATSAQLNTPFGVITDASGNIYFSDGWNNVVRKINTSGIITTIAGTGFGAGGNCTGSYSGDNISATTAKLNNPVGITLDTAGNLFIADLCNNRIRKVTNVAVGIQEQTASNQQINIFPNPNNGNFTIEYKVEQDAVIEVRDVQGKLVCKNILPTNQSNASITCENLENGVYLFKVLIGGTVLQTKKLIIVK